MDHGRLYQTLDDLVDRGLVDKGQHNERANAYATTADGRTLLERRARRLRAVVSDPPATGRDPETTV